MSDYVNGADLYAVLGVAADATNAEIKAVYRKLARNTHPDGQRPEYVQQATSAMREINAAYDVLGDPVSRRQYDEQRYGWDERWRVASQTKSAARGPAAKRARTKATRPHATKEAQKRAAQHERASAEAAARAEQREVERRERERAQAKAERERRERADARAAEQRERERQRQERAKAASKRMLETRARRAAYAPGPFLKLASPAVRKLGRANNKGGAIVVAVGAAMLDEYLRKNR